MPEPITRPNYFDGQLLGAEDFILDQTYAIARRRLHNRLLHTWGVAQGLTISFATGASTATISAGVAYDSLGREIVLAADAQTPSVGNQPGATLYVTIAYTENQTTPRSMGGATGNARWTESPTIALNSAAPADPSTQLVLGRLSVGANGQIAGSDDGVDPARRRTTGATWPSTINGNLQVTGNLGLGLAPTTSRLQVLGGAWDVSNSEGDVTIGNSTYRLRIGVALAGAGAGDARLRAFGGTNRLMLGGGTNDTLTIAGANVGIRNIYPGYALDVTGDIHFSGNLIGGGKGGFVMDRFINTARRPLERGDVVVIAANQADLVQGPDGEIPIPRVETADHVGDQRVCGVVYEAVAAGTGDAIAVGKTGWMVTLGAFAACKVDAAFGAIQPGDLLIASSVPGYAQRAPDRGALAGCVIGKALRPLSNGRGAVPVLVTLR